MKYPVVIHKEQSSDYGVTVPDVPGCFSAGETMTEALENVREALELHFEGLLADGEPLPLPLPLPLPQEIDVHAANPD